MLASWIRQVYIFAMVNYFCNACDIIGLDSFGPQTSRVGQTSWEGCDRCVPAHGPRAPPLWPPPRAGGPHPCQGAPPSESNLFPLAGNC